MRKSILLLGVACIAWHSVASATSVTFTAAGSQRLVESSTGTLLTNLNAFVWLGNFTTESFTFNSAASIASNVAAIKAAGGWRQFGFDSTGDVNEADVFSLGVTNASKISGTITDINSPGADYFGKLSPVNTSKAYLWIFKGTSLLDATEMGIFRSPDAGIPWAFPANGGGIGDAVTLSDTSVTAPNISAFGAGSATSTRLILSAASAVVPVPEPSTFVFGVSLCIAATSLRRRRNQ
ncbi:MAG: hypothetical protein ABIP20_04205 [Chthoniobacteraceae bacterium]